MSRKLLIAVAAILVLALLAACAGGDETPVEVEETDEAAATEEVPVEEPTEEEAEPTAEATAEATVEGAAGVPVDEIETQHIFTTGTTVVGIGTYIAAEPYGVAAGEDPAAQPATAMILPYAVYPNMLLEDPAEFEQPEPLVEDMTFAWTLEGPEGSSAELASEGPVALFQADVAGDYTLTLTATDAAGNEATATQTYHATTYVGVGTVVGDAEPPQCAVCHADQTEAWAATGHATMLARGLNGELSDHYNANCISCHTTGFNNLEGADANGFDDVARAAGWEFPGTLGPGTWEAMQEDFPEVAEMANIQCESCHGPGADHSGAGPIGTGLSYATCAQCHAEDPYHVFPQQWELSPHAQKTARAFWYPIGENRTACVQCHTGGGFIDAANGVPEEERRTEYQVITCAVCHDPHDAANPNQLRVFDTVTLPNGVEVADAGPAATCMTCHNMRVGPQAAVEAGVSEIMQGDQGTGTYRVSTPHYSSAAELLTGGDAGYTWGETLPNTPHGQIIEGTCIGCHMAATPSNPDAEPGADDTPGHNTVGQHTFLMTSPVDGTENIAVCQQCHTDAESLDFEASGDYDGDGATETVHEELEGLLEVLKPALEAKGVVVLESHPYYNVPQDANEDIIGSVYNYHMIMETVHRGSQAHNPAYLVSLAQLTYEKLTGAPLANAVAPGD